MSTDFIVVEKDAKAGWSVVDVNFDELVKKLKDAGVNFPESDENTEDSMAACDDDGNYVWLYKDPHTDRLYMVSRYGANWDQTVTKTIQEILPPGHVIVDEYDDRYWEATGE